MIHFNFSRTDKKSAWVFEFWSRKFENFSSGPLGLRFPYFGVGNTKPDSLSPLRGIGFRISRSEMREFFTGPFFRISRSEMRKKNWKTILRVFFSKFGFKTSKPEEGQFSDPHFRFSKPSNFFFDSFRKMRNRPFFRILGSEIRNPIHWALFGGLGFVFWERKYETRSTEPSSGD